MLAEPFAEMLEPRGESSLVSGCAVRFAWFTRVVGHPPLAKKQEKGRQPP
jgi:hypothetical protein